MVPAGISLQDAWLSRWLLIYSMLLTPVTDSLGRSRAVKTVTPLSPNSSPSLLPGKISGTSPRQADRLSCLKHREFNMPRPQQGPMFETRRQERDRFGTLKPGSGLLNHAPSKKNAGLEAWRVAYTEAVVSSVGFPFRPCSRRVNAFFLQAVTLYPDRLGNGKVDYYWYDFSRRQNICAPSLQLLRSIFELGSFTQFSEAGVFLY